MPNGEIIAVLLQPNASPWTRDSGMILFLEPSPHREAHYEFHPSRILR